MIEQTSAICGLTVIPVRATTEDTAEIVTQLLFGELVSILEKHNQWIKIRIAHDQYEGWVDRKQLLSVSSDFASTYPHEQKRQQEGVLTIETPWGEQNVVQGSPILSKNTHFKIDDYHFRWINKTPLVSIKSPEELALNYLNSPYLWGGRSPFGIDCSGLTQTVYHQLGINIPRDASQQFLKGEKVRHTQKKSGDLAFFESKKTGNIHHVGIVLLNNKIIHAHGRVRIDTLNEKGIYNEEEKYYSHELKSINRI